MDKEWMSKNRLSQEYEDGVESFLRFAKQNLGNHNTIPCPCVKCGNVWKKNVETIRAHLCRNGMDLTYHTWIWHGERSKSGVSINENDEVGQGEKDFVAEELVDMVHEYADDPNEFSKLLEDAEKPLYPGCTEFTKLSAVVKLYNLKAKYGWSDSSFTDLLSLFRHMLPDKNELPQSLYEAKKSMCSLGMDYVKIDACPNDCILYRKQYENVYSCPTCGVSRWKLGKNGKTRENISAKVLWYFPPIPRFLRMFRNKEISKELTWHADKRVRDGKMRHPADAPCWKVVDHKWPDFKLDPRNLRLAISADGINPHKLMSSTYSCWPVVMIMYNLPPWLCMKRKFMMLTLLISGPKQPGNDIDVYLAPLVDDLKYLWEIGVQAYDAYRQESFLLKVVLLWTINDFPAYGNMSGCSVKGYCACPICGEKTNSTRLKHSRKISFQGHRRFLRASHPYRKQKKAFDGKQEFREAPKPLSGYEVLKAVDGVNCRWGKLSGKPQSSNVDSKSYWKKKSVFFELEYWKDLHIRHVLDVMHIEKNVCESLIGTLLHIPGKTKDGVKARLDLVEMNMRTELAPQIGEKRTFLPLACYTLSKDEKKKVCNSLLGMKVPTGYSSNIRNLVSMKELKLVGLKSHDCHTLMQQLLPVEIRGVLPKHVRYAITKLCFFFNVICSKVIDPTKLDAIQDDIVTTVCLLEKYFPPSFFDVMVHLTVHLVREVKLCGPNFYRWMYPFERYMRILKGHVRNRNRPEGCMAECYIAEEAVEFCSGYLANMHTIGIPSTPLQNNLTKPLSSSHVQPITDQEWKQAHLYVLTNDVEIEPYASEHKEHLKETYPLKAHLEKWILEKHNQTFVSWLHNRVMSSSHRVSERLKWLAHGPRKQVLKYQSYLINGVTYYTKELDSVRVVQNSGVSLVAKIMQVSSAKDKNPIESDMVFYGVIEEIWELDYTNFRIPMFKCNWVENNKGTKVDDLGFTLVNFNRIGFKSDSFIMGNQAKQVFYIDDPEDPAWSIVLSTPNRDYFEYMNGDDLGDTIIQHQCFSKGIPPVDLDDIDENEPPCIRSDCDGIWVDS